MLDRMVLKRQVNAASGGETTADLKAAMVASGRARAGAVPNAIRTHQGRRRTMRTPGCDASLDDRQTQTLQANLAHG